MIKSAPPNPMGASSSTTRSQCASFSTRPVRGPSISRRSGSPGPAQPVGTWPSAGQTQVLAAARGALCVGSCHWLWARRLFPFTCAETPAEVAGVIARIDANHSLYRDLLRYVAFPNNPSYG